MRPALHFTPASGWINDPHGITARDGGYDAFFQYVPGPPQWRLDCHWGHASGPDLLSLTELPVAIAPGDGDDGIWTGCVVGDGADARAFYTSVSARDLGMGRVRAARPANASWLAWKKGDVVAEAPADLDLVAYRDPFVRREGGGWRMFVGASGRDGTAMALTYTCDDLDRWTYDGIALERNTAGQEPVWTGALWECPQIFDLDGTAVMVASAWEAEVIHHAIYALGGFADGRFAAQHWGRLTWGPGPYAPSVFTDADGRAALTFWLRGIEGDGWAGAHSIPYLLAVRDGRLVATPHPDVAAHRVEACADGRVDGLAADLEWTAATGELTVGSGGEVVATLARDGAEAVVTTATRQERFPVSSAVRVIVDGPVLEICSDAGLFATAIEPRGSGLEVSVSAGGLAVWRLA